MSNGVCRALQNGDILYENIFIGLVNLGTDFKWIPTYGIKTNEGCFLTKYKFYKGLSKLFELRLFLQTYIYNSKIIYVQ